MEEVALTPSDEEYSNQAIIPYKHISITSEFYWT